MKKKYYGCMHCLNNINMHFIIILNEHGIFLGISTNLYQKNKKTKNIMLYIVVLLQMSNVLCQYYYSCDVLSLLISLL